jgi:DNA polymerase I-like protein with 3'-5' exonuclease and polymerase domains/intein/homing endonuclease
MAWADDKKIHIITSLAQLEALLPAIQAAPIIAVDTETTGLKRFDVAVGIGFCWSLTEACYIPISVYNKDKGLIRPWKEAAYDSLVKSLKLILTASKRVIGHNIIYDAKIIKNTFNLDIMDYVMGDTQAMYHTAVSEEGPLGLKAISSIHIDPAAANPQDDVKAAVKEVGGSWNESNKEFYKAPYTLLGRYCAFDTLYTYHIYDKFFCELEKQNLTKLWNEEVVPLLKVTYDLNTVGLRIDVPYFEKLKSEMTETIEALEDELYSSVEKELVEYETSLIKEQLKSGKLKVTSRSELGKLLLELGINEDDKDRYLETIKYWYKKKNGLRTIFNLNSSADKAFLLYDLLGFECTEFTKSGERSVTKAIMSDIEKKHGDHPTIKILTRRNAEIKLLTTYVIPFLEQHINGRIYPAFNQTGTISGRYSSDSPNFQNVPSKDKRIKKGIIADDGMVFVNADFASLEPRSFAFMSGDPGLKKVYSDNLDLYSKIGIDVLGLKNVSADPKADNYLKKVDERARDKVKVFCLDKKSKVTMSDTKIKSLSKIDIGDIIHNKYGNYKVVNTVQSIKSVVRFITRRGGIVCTPDHKIWSSSDNCFKRADEFRLGELVEFTGPCLIEHSTYVELDVFSSIGAKNNSLVPMYKLKFNEDWAWILGAFLGDGIGSYTVMKTAKAKKHNSLRMSGYIGICGLEKDNICSEFSKFFEDRGYHVSKKVRDSKKSGKFLMNTVSDLFLTSLFQTTLLAFEYNGAKCQKNLEVQDFIFNSPINVRLAFIAGLLDTDGYLKSKGPNRSDVAFCSKNYEFIAQIQHLLRTVGVDSSMHISYNKTYEKDYYILRISTSGCLILSQLGIVKYIKCSRKQTAFTALTNAKIRKCNVKNEVLRVEPIKEERSVIDITVDSKHEFYANGLRVHNCLQVPYGTEAFKLSHDMGISQEEAQDLIDSYLGAYPELGKFMEQSRNQAKKLGYVTNIMGRKRRFKAVPLLYNRYGVRDFSFMNLTRNVYPKLKSLHETYKEPKHLSSACRNELNNSTNFRIQSLAGSIANAAAIELREALIRENLNASICLQVHDELCVLSSKEHSERVKELVQYYMENNNVSKMLDVPMVAEPKLAYNLAEAK